MCDDELERKYGKQYLEYLEECCSEPDDLDYSTVDFPEQLHPMSLEQFAQAMQPSSYDGEYL